MKLTKNNWKKIDVKSAEITIVPNLAVHEDQRTKYKSVAFPFTFSSGENGVLIITRLHKSRFEPEKEIKSIVINFT